MKFIRPLLAAAACVIYFAGKSQTVDLSGKDLPITKVFSSIKTQTGYVFFYDAGLLQQAKPVSVQLKNSPLEEALQIIFRDQNFSWLIENRTITVTQKMAAPVASEDLPKADLLNISGTIKDPVGDPVVGASVIVKGTKHGTSSNEKGNFSIQARRGSILVFSSINYTERQITTSGSGNINIRLDLEYRPMERLVVGGNVMTVKKKADVASVSVIDSKTLDALPYQNIEQIYRGLVPGANNIQSGYEVPQYAYGSGSVSLRGSAGFGGYGVIKTYVNGMSFAPNSYALNTFDKNNIDRIEVVKGPSASTLYGSGASGGVLLIYTKTPKPNTTTLNVMSSAGWYDSKWQSKKPFRQVHAINFMQGFKNFSYVVAGDIDNNETYMPDGKQDKHTLYASVAFTNNKNNLKITANGQHFDNDYSPERNAYWDTSSNAYFNKPGIKLPDSANFKVRSNIAGINVNYNATDWWQHYVTTGWSKYSEHNESLLKNPTTVQSEGKTITSTIMYYNTVSLFRKSAFKTVLLTGVEYSNVTSSAFLVRNGGNRIETDSLNFQKNTGLFAQLTPSFQNKIFLTISGRYEINKTFGTSFNPRIGATTNFSWASLIIKPRVAWGKGITAPAWRDRFPLPSVNGGITITPNEDLKPQEQEGWDFGIEGVSKNNKISCEISYYDYILKNGIYTDRQVTSGGIFITNRNAGKLANNGWEFALGYKWKNFMASGNYSIINSILKEPLNGVPNAKDIVQPEEQVSFIARNTGGLTVAYSFPKTFGTAKPLSVSAGLTYTSGPWSIDQVRYIYDVGVNRNSRNFLTYGPRYYRMKLNASTKFNFNIDYGFAKNFQVFMQLSNIFNNTTPEYLSTFPCIGRGWMFGVKYNYNKKKS